MTSDMDGVMLLWNWGAGTETCAVVSRNETETPKIQGKGRATTPSYGQYGHCSVSSSRSQVRVERLACGETRRLKI